MLRFPLEDYSPELPWLLFTSYDSDYLFNGNMTIVLESKEEIALYMPAGFAVNDNLAYEDATGGNILSLAQTFGQPQSFAEFRQNLLSAAGDAGAGLLRGVGQTAADFLTPGSDVTSLFNRARGRVSNPNRFSIFQSPGLREFSFTFKLIPQSEKEADEIPKIIKSFRLASYPDISQSRLEFTVPKVFKIKIINSEQTIRIPFVACQSISVTYNPSSMSFFEHKNTPSEIDLTLSFKELTQLTKQEIEEGF